MSNAIRPEERACESAFATWWQQQPKEVRLTRTEQRPAFAAAWWLQQQAINSLRAELARRQVHLDGVEKDLAACQRHRSNQERIIRALESKLAEAAREVGRES